MIPFIVPSWIRKTLDRFPEGADLRPEQALNIRLKLEEFTPDRPVVSVVIPVWNEGAHLARTLYTLSRLKPSVPTEIIVVNNNSTDNTQSILDECGARSIFEPRQGVGYARQSGLEAARGEYILTGDGDTLYPEGWVDALVSRLAQPNTAAVWAQHSFIPSRLTARPQYALYEILKQLWYRLRNRTRPHLNAMGANLGFYRDLASLVGGYDVRVRSGEDGRLALALADFGDIVAVRAPEARVWTSARRLEAEGSLITSLGRRMKKEIPRIREYVSLGPA
jgi:glycosyltransferase involved in cell wall biosynthesis